MAGRRIRREGLVHNKCKREWNYGSWQMKRSALATQLFVCGGDLSCQSEGAAPLPAHHAAARSIIPPPALFSVPYKHLSIFFGFFLMSSSCISPSECVTAVVCLFSFSSLRTFTGLRDLRWTWTLKGSPSFLIPILHVFPHTGRFLGILNRMRGVMKRCEECRMRKMTRHHRRFIFLKLWLIRAISHFFSIFWPNKRINSDDGKYSKSKLACQPLHVCHVPIDTQRFNRVHHTQLLKHTTRGLLLILPLLPSVFGVSSFPLFILVLSFFFFLNSLYELRAKVMCVVFFWGERVEQIVIALKK